MAPAAGVDASRSLAPRRGLRREAFMRSDPSSLSEGIRRKVPWRSTGSISLLTLLSEPHPSWARNATRPGWRCRPACAVSRRRWRATRCGTASRRIGWSGGRTYVPCKSCCGTTAWERRRATPMRCGGRGWGRRARWRTRARCGRVTCGPFDRGDASRWCWWWCG